MCSLFHHKKRFFTFSFLFFKKKKEMSKFLFYGYIRLSEEDETNTGIETQIKTIEKYVAEKYEDTVISKFFIDNGYSGVLTVDERPALKEFFELVSSSFVDASVNLVVYHPDRLSRDSFIFRSITNALSDKCVTLHFVTEGGEGNDTLIFFKTIIAEQERKNTIRRVNNFFKYNSNNWDSRVGYGWVWNDVLKKKEPHPEEYVNLLLIKKLYEEEYCLLTEIALILKEKGIKKRNGEDWTTTNLEFVIKRNGYRWDKTFIDERKKRVFLKSKEEIVSFDNDCEIYKFFFEGKKYCCSSKNEKESETDSKIKEKLHFWIHKEKEKYYSNDELVKKIKSEFPCKETCSKRVLWEFIREARKNNN